MTEKRIGFENNSVEFSIHEDDGKWFKMIFPDDSSSMCRMLTTNQLLQLAYFIIDAVGCTSEFAYPRSDGGINLNGERLTPLQAEEIACALICSAANSRRLAKDENRAAVSKKVHALANEIGIEEMKRILEE